jgi:hypothetical protein
MKKIILFAGLLFSSLAFKAQAQVSLNINIGSQPDWGPVGYDHVDYYYLPDIDAYYDVPAHRYVYYDNNAWVRRSYLPARYSNFNVYNSYKVVVNEPRPWTRADVYRTKYVNYKGRHDQVIIRDSRDDKYKDHWKGKPGKGHFKGKGKGHDKGHGRGHGKH